MRGMARGGFANIMQGERTMNKLWAGRSEAETSALADAFNSSIAVDGRMYRQDITGSMAHAAMLAKCGILTQADTDAIIDGLAGILADLESGALQLDPQAEDIHMFVEAELTKRIGDVGKKLHTARSRNDQVALDLRMYLKDEIKALQALVLAVMQALHTQAEANKDAIMPGYTHLQRAQPITFGQQLLAYAMMLERDYGRLADAYKRTDASPIGCCALAGTTYPTDRVWEAQQLGFAAVCENSLDGVSDRDFCVELMSACALVMMHLSRLSEELILWSSWEFQFIELDSGFTTGSSIMPQKKNPDMAELCRGKTGRVYGDLIALLTTLKGLPLAYNKDMQEDKEALFDARDTLVKCLNVFTGMFKTLKFRKDVMHAGAGGGFANATDAADYLVKKGLPFREAHEVLGRLVLHCIKENKALLDLPLAELKEFSPLFEQDVYDAISLETCIRQRNVPGGPAPAMVENTIRDNRDFLAAH